MSTTRIKSNSEAKFENIYCITETGSKIGLIMAGLEPNALVCHNGEDGKLYFGKVSQETDEEGLHHVLWDDETGGVRNPLVYDKLFVEGQHVCRIKDGVIGQVTRVNCLASCTASCDKSKFVIGDIPVDRVQPISAIYPGANVAYNGWVGTVEELKQELSFRFPDRKNSICRKTSVISRIRKEEQGKISSKYSLLTQGPSFGRRSSLYSFQTKNIACEGQQIKLSFRELRYAKWKGYTTWKHPAFLLAWHFRLKTATVASAEVNSVQISWHTCYQESYIPSKTMCDAPPKVFIKDQINQLKPLFIMPSEYIQDDTLAMIQWSESDRERVETEDEWQQTFLDSITGASSVDQHEEIPAKRARLDFATRYPDVGSKVPVHVRIIRHELEVNWENGISSTIMASQVEIPQNLPHIPIPPRQKYLAMKPFVRSDGATDGGRYCFGVNLGAHGENMIDVAWVRKQVHLEPVQMEPTDGERLNATENQSSDGSDGPVQRIKHVEFILEAKTRESIFDVECHRVFTDCVTLDQRPLTIGLSRTSPWDNVVFRSESCTNANFEMGVIQNVGFDGRLVIRDGNLQPAFRLWPDEVQGTISPAASASYSQPQKTLADISQQLIGGRDTLTLLPTRDFEKRAPTSHYFFSSSCFRNMSDGDRKSLRCKAFRDYMVLHNLLPDNVWLRGYDDRYDLHSLLVIGPAGTPFEDFIFTFDINLSWGYPFDLPFVRLNQSSQIPLSPYILEDGRVDLNALNPPLMEPTNIYSLHSVISVIYESIFNPTPMAAPDTIVDPTDLNQMVKLARQNQAVCIACLDMCIQTLANPPEPWSHHIIGYYTATLPIITETVAGWVTNGAPFPLLPTTEGFTISVNRRLGVLRQLTDAVASSFFILNEDNVTPAEEQKESNNVRLNSGPSA